MSRKSSLEAIAALYNIAGLGSTYRENSKNIEIDSGLFEEKYAGKRSRKRKQSIYEPDDDNDPYSIRNLAGILERDRREEDDLSYHLIPNFKEKKFNEIYKKPYSGLEKILLEEKNKNYIENKEIYNLISKNSEINNKKIEYIKDTQLDDLVSHYEFIGYRQKRKDISPEQPVAPEQPAVRAPQLVEVTRQGLPAEYKPILAMLAQKLPGVKYQGMEHLEKSQHHVDILTFEYEVNGKPQQIHVVLKDRNIVEERLPAFLQSLGIPVHSVYDAAAGRAFVMQHVGDRSLRQAIQGASEADIRRLSEKALETIAQIHVLATAHLPELKRDYGIELAAVDYNQEFRRRFLEPVSGHSKIISPQMDRMTQAYAAFAKTFTPRSVIHGDYHDVNCREAEGFCYPIDWEWAAIGREFDDVSRLVNSVARDRPDMDAADYSREMLKGYIEKHNEHAEQEKSPLMLANKRLAAAFRNALINDELYKAGEYVLFGETHPDVKQEKMQKSADCMERIFRMLDGSIELADRQRDYFEWESLTNLRQALVDYVAASPIQTLREVADSYKKSAGESLVLVPAA
jgi:aminoglycoside phosphotransferase (APT) family kinase protein